MRDVTRYNLLSLAIITAIYAPFDAIPFPPSSLPPHWHFYTL